MLWTSFKDRLGQSKGDVILFDLQSLIHSVPMPGLNDPFGTGEINALVKELPIDKAPGPDGFNGLFIKKCWPMIKKDFFELFSAFYQNQIDMRCLNCAFITLVPKTNSPMSVNDYRPISLLGCTIKLITKMLANKFHKVITSMLHDNQYGFIKQRSI
jgi:hypothetical protein